MKEIVDFVIYFIAMYMCIVCYDLCYAKLKNYKIKFNIKTTGLIFMTSVIILINNFYNPVDIKATINLFVLSFELKMIFQDKFKVVIINYIFIYFLIIIMEIVTTDILLKINLLPNNTSANTLSYQTMMLTVLIGLLEYFIISIKKVRESFNKIIELFINNQMITNIIYLIFASVVVLSMIYIKNFANVNSIKLIIILFTIFIILFISIIRLKFSEEMLKISNKKLIDYNDNYGKFLDEYKIYKHNINHKLFAIKAYGNKKVNSLIDALIEEETDFNIRNNDIYNVPNGIKGIVAEKLYNKKFSVIINNKIKRDPFEKLDSKSFNSISESLGIVLDNAIEASESTKNPVIIMDLFESKDAIFIKVGNNFINAIDFDNLGNKYYSTKNRGSGLGLFSIHRNNLVKEKIDIVNDFYFIELQIKKAR